MKNQFKNFKLPPVVIFRDIFLNCRDTGMLKNGKRFVMVRTEKIKIRSFSFKVLISFINFVFIGVFLTINNLQIEGSINFSPLFLLLIIFLIFGLIFFFIREVNYFYFFHFFILIFFLFFVYFIQMQTQTICFELFGFQLKKFFWIEEELFNIYDLKVQQVEEGGMRNFFCDPLIRKEIVLKSNTPEQVYFNMLESWGEFCFRQEREEEERRKMVHLQSPFEVSKMRWVVIGGLVIFSIVCCFSFYFSFDIKTFVSSPSPSPSPSLPTSIPVVSSDTLLPFVSVPEVMEPISVALSSGMGNTIPVLSEQEQELVNFFREF